MLRRDTYLPFGRPDFGDEEMSAVTRIMRTGWVGMGSETLAFERELAEACGAPAVVTVNSCTSALFLSLVAHGIGPGDEVVVPSLTWISTANVVRQVGATVVFCDVDPGTLSVSPATVRAVLGPRTRAVIVVHLGGLAVDVAAIRRAVPAHIPIVEDAAHAFGARFADGRPVGASGNLTCFSFYANKNLSTGEGGAVALADEAVADRLRSLRQHGLPQDAWKRFVDPRRLETPRVRELGFKMNYTDLQAAIGRVQLRRQPVFARRRLDVARAYRETLAQSPWPFVWQDGLLDEGHARHLCLVQLPIERLAWTRHEVLAALRERNIGASLHYQPVHTMPLYAGATPFLPVTDRLSARILTLPISASMTTDDARLAASALVEVLDEARESRVSLGAAG
ncbi:MAG: DegT/DnrJ/EryC1/StrS aminotransferase family protein [Acidobacteria bacterium]|nr:DegT/DnrJ/EryC1/StrS aminotransferase family protein [Acidobacteriota bacterium]